MVRAKEQNSTMSYFRGICYPASIWIPYRELHNTSQVRKLLLMGWTKKVVDGAREIIYNFIRNEIGEDIFSLHSVINQHDVWETWSRSQHPMLTEHESLNQMTSSRLTVSKNEDYLHDPHTPNGSQRRYDGTRWDEPNRTPDGHPEYGNNVKINAHELTSDDDDFAAILNLPPVKMKTELEIENDMIVVVSDEDDAMDNRCEVVNAVTEIDMIQDAETEGNVKISVEHDQIVIKRLINKEKPDQGVLCETITVGTTITCKTCFGTEIEGEVLAFNAHTRTVIIKPAPISDKPLRNGKHMVNIDYVTDIRIMRVCTGKPPEPTTVNMKRVHTNMKAER